LVIVIAVAYVAMTAPENITPPAQVMVVPTPETYNQDSAFVYRTYAEGNKLNAEAGALSTSSKSEAALDYVMVMALAVVTVMGVGMFVKVLKMI
jgi:hypothetical protein